MIDKLAIYEHMAALTAQMVAAAQQADWDQLTELEHHVGAMRDQLIAADRVAVVPEADETRRARKVALIQRMLADDREIRRHTEPWMESVRTLLAGNARQRNLRTAYNLG